MSRRRKMFALLACVPSVHGRYSTNTGINERICIHVHMSMHNTWSTYISTYLWPEHMHTHMPFQYMLINTWSTHMSTHINNIYVYTHRDQNNVHTRTWSVHVCTQCMISTSVLTHMHVYYLCPHKKVQLLTYMINMCLYIFVIRIHVHTHAWSVHMSTHMHDQCTSICMCDQCMST